MTIPNYAGQNHQKKAKRDKTIIYPPPPHDQHQTQSVFTESGKATVNQERDDHLKPLMVGSKSLPPILEEQCLLGLLGCVLYISIVRYPLGLPYLPCTNMAELTHRPSPQVCVPS